MKTASNPRGRRKGLIFAALTALAVILGLFMPGLAPLLGAQAADLEIDPDATNDLIVTKTFTGDIEASEIPEDLVITLTSESGEVLTTTSAEVIDSDSAFEKKWMFRDVPVGTYTVTESGQEVSGYTVTSTQEAVAVNPPPFILTQVQRDTPNNTLDWPISLTDDTNTFFAASLTKGEGVAVLTLNQLSAYQQQVVTSRIAEVGGPFGGIDKKGITFYNVDAGGNSFTAENGGTFTYDPEKGLVHIGDESHWTQLVLLSFNTKGATAETAVVNDYKAQTTTLEGNKTWDDNDDQDGKRPESITIRVFDGDKQVAVQEVTAEDNWSWKFEGLREYRGGEKIVYTITEDPIEGYTSVVNGYDVTNTHAPETVEISGSKTWNDVNNQDGVRPESITIRLLQNGTEIDSVTVTAGDNWAWSFTDLPKYATGQEIEYTIVEDEVEGYTTTVDGYDVTNTHAPETVEINGSKTWNDANNQDGKRPESITIRLLQNGTEIDSQTVTAADNWAWSFTNLPKFQEGEVGVANDYSIAEITIPEYSSEINGYDVTNTHTPGQTSVQVTKAWDDAGNQDGVRPNSVTIKLVANGEATDRELTLNADNNWTGTFTELDEYAAGSKIIYTVAEVGIGNGYTTTITGDANEGFVVTNSRTPETIAVEGSKTWDDADNQDGIRPGSITIRLLADGEEVASKQVTAADNWAWSFTDLPKFADGEEIVYTVTEDAVDGYTTTVDGYNVTNTHTPETVAVEGSKTWDDAENQDRKRPASITIRLLADGEEVTSKQVTAADDWAWSFTDLPKYAVGQEIVYTITEDSVSDYYSEVNGYDVTNTHEPETMVIEGFKTWDDAENQDGMRPESITIRVLANGEEVASKQVTATDNWTWFFTDLPRFANGEEIVYTIAEDAVPEYSSEIDGYDVTNTHTPGQTSVQVTKAWDDADDQDGVRPDSVTIKLIANGEATDKELTLNADNNWTGTFTELDEYAAGDKIVYTVEEVQIGNGYTTTITGDATEGYVVTNSRTPATTELEGMKTWQDGDNQDGIRPDSITVRVLANGEQVASKQVTAEDDWTWSFTGLPVFEKGQVIEYTIIEDEVEGYETFVDGFNLVNTHEPEMTMVEGSKTWDDNDNQNSKRPESITIRLLADGEEVASKQVTADDDWAWSFTDLPKFNSGKEIVYTITEDEVDGYTTTVDGYNVTNKIIPEEPKKPTLPKTGVATGTFLGVGTLLFVAGAALVGMRKRRS